MEASVACFKVLSKHLFAKTKKDHGNLQSIAGLRTEFQNENL